MRRNEKIFHSVLSNDKPPLLLKAKKQGVFHFFRRFFRLSGIFLCFAQYKGIEKSRLISQTAYSRLSILVLLFGAYFAKNAPIHSWSELLQGCMWDNYIPAAKTVNCTVSELHRQHLLSGIN